MKNLMRLSPRALANQGRQYFQDPWSTFTDMKSDMERLFTENDMSTEFKSYSFSPSCDIREDKKEYIVNFDIPGVKKENVKIEVENNCLTVQGERKEVKDEKASKYHLSESYQGAFMRSFNLPTPVDEDNIDAHYEDGVLTIKILKLKSSNAKKIDIH